MRQVLDAGLKLQTRQLANVLERVVPSYANPIPVFRTTYLDDELRISRDQVREEVELRVTTWRLDRVVELTLPPPLVRDSVEKCILPT